MTIQTLHTDIEQVHTFVNNGNTVFVFELTLREAFPGLEIDKVYTMQIYQFHLAGRFMPSQMAMVRPGDSLSLTADGISLSAEHGFIEFDSLKSFQRNVHQLATI